MILICLRFWLSFFPIYGVVKVIMDKAIGSIYYIFVYVYSIYWISQ